MHDDIPKIAAHTPDLALERQSQLRELFPEAWSEGELDFSKLRQLLGDLADESAERYRFGWAGKRESLGLLQTPSRATLRPVPGESVDFDTTGNLFIEGDNLEALKLLYKPLFNRVKMIYIDPPYNTGNDFIYPDNFADPLKHYLIQTGQKDPNGDLQTSNPDMAGRVHSRWLSMLYPRLTLARSLLRDDGVIFVSIDDNEVHHLRLLMNEVFGEENFVANIAVVNNLKGRNDRAHIATAHEHLLMYSKGEFVSYGLQLTQKQLADYGEVNEEGEAFQWRDLRKRGGADTKQARPTLYYPLYTNKEDGRIYLEQKDEDDVTIMPMKSDGSEGCWRWSKEKVTENLDRIRASRSSIKDKWNVSYQVRLVENGKTRVAKPKSVWIGSQFSSDSGTKALKELISDVSDLAPKPVGFIKTIVQQSTEEDDIILDFFAGSGTTGQAVLELNREDGGNRRFVLVQLPEKTGNAQFPTIADIGKERIRRVIGRMKEGNGTLDLSTREAPEDLGFKVWKLGESHFRQFQRTEPGDTKAYLEQLELMNDALLPGYETRAVLYEVALREGYGLNCTLELVPGLEGVEVWRVSDADKGQHFYATLADSLDLESLRPLKLVPDDLFICRGIALDDDTAANLALQCRLKMI